MNIELKNSINSIAKLIIRWFGDLTGTIVSIFRIAVLSSPTIAIKTHHYDRLRISDNCSLLANGPSLKDAFQNEVEIFENTDIFCVNSFCESDYFWRIKPSFYYVVDGAFFRPNNERHQKKVEKLVSALSRVDWKMKLAIPSYYSPDNLISQISNDNISILRFNTTKVTGFKWFRNFCYKHYLGMPVCMNVTIFAVMAAVWMGYKKIILYGLELGMFTTLSVDQDNVLCYEDGHVYETNKTIIKKYGRSLAEELQGFVDCFNSHTEIDRYAKVKGCQILNATKGSFVDAYERI